MIFRSFKLTAFVIAMIFSSSSLAGTYTCHGQVKGLSIDPTNGTVLGEVIGSLSWPRLCSVQQDYNGVSADACKVIYSTLLSAQLANKKVTIWFNDSKDCSAQSHTPWRPLKGWYFGPKISD